MRSRGNINATFNWIASWLNANRLFFNIEKIQLALSGKKGCHSQLNVCGVEISIHTSGKYPGFHLDKRLTFGFHIAELLRKASRHSSVTELRTIVTKEILLLYHNVYKTLDTILHTNIRHYHCK